MPAYRFCRPDDIPLLVRAINDCWDVHFPDEPAMTVERFRREMKELDVWPSNSMVAMGGSGGGEPIAVSIGTKRAREVLVRRVGVRPDYQRQGHGRHLVTSLGQKLAVLGPPRLAAEVPLALPAAEAFFEALGYRREEVYTDYRREPGGVAGDLPPEDLVVAVTGAELDAAGALALPAGVAWERSRETLAPDAASGWPARRWSRRSGWRPGCSFFRRTTPAERCGCSPGAPPIRPGATASSPCSSAGSPPGAARPSSSPSWRRMSCQPVSSPGWVSSAARSTLASPPTPSPCEFAGGGPRGGAARSLSAALPAVRYLRLDRSREGMLPGRSAGGGDPDERPMNDR